MNKIIQKAIFLIAAGFMSFQSWAQDKGVDVDIDINKKDSNWYQQPWVWIVGGAVFLLLLIALLRGGGKRD